MNREGDTRYLGLTTLCQESIPAALSPRARHANAKTSLEHYIKSVPENVRVAVEPLDHLLKSKPGVDPTVRAN